MECIDKNTVNQSELINDVFLGQDAQVSLLARENLISESLAPSISKRAKYFTINVGDRIGPDYQMTQLFVSLKNNLYEVFVHDPRFFTLNWIPVALPSLHSGGLDENKLESYFYTLLLTEVKELNLPQDPCNQDEKYNFQVDPFCSEYRLCQNNFMISDVH